MMKTVLLMVSVMLGGIAAAGGDWTASDGANAGAPGRKIEIRADRELVATFIYGEGQTKPFLHLFGSETDCLTDWGAEQQFPHHRGFFIGWNKIASDLGTFDLWHMKGGRMNVAKFEKIEGGRDSAKLVATIEWRGEKKDVTGSDLLLSETRTLVISRPQPKRTQVDATFVLKAARDLTLGGDLQHAGVHFRGSKELGSRKDQTSYLWEPDLPGPGGKVQSSELKWARLDFPIGPRWYSATLLNSPGNPVEQLSWRDYGRFGFFFTRSLKKDEALSLRYRLLIEHEEKLREKPTREQSIESRRDADARYQEFTRAVKGD